MLSGRTVAAGAALATITLLSLATSGVATDSDGDGLSDAFEQRWGITDPARRDSDHDGVIDAAEDDDGDRLGNLAEQRFGTDPGTRDSDADGISDGNEDHDGDGRRNALEQDQRPLPPGLRPAIGPAARDYSPLRWRCQTRQGSARPVICRFGPRDATTRIVLVGDSHAAVWSSPIRRVAADKGWRLETMMKTACAPILGVQGPKQWDLDRARSCRGWRRRVIAALNERPPDLIILAHSDRYELLDAKGRRRPRGSFTTWWAKGVARTISSLPRTSRILVLGDVPRNDGNPRKCLERHPRDMSRCTSRKRPIAKRPIEQAIRTAALDHGARFRTLYGKICTYDPCPLVQGRILMWRDRSHLTETFARQLHPSMRAILEDALPATARQGH